MSPLSVFTSHSLPCALQGGDAREALDAVAQVLGALGIGLHQLAGIDVAVERVVEPADDAVHLHERILVLDLVRADHLEGDALRARHRGDVAVLVHARLVVGEADRAGDVIVDRIADLVAQRRIELGRVALQLDDVPRGGEVGDIARRVPGRAGAELVHLQQQAVGPAHLGQMIQRAAPDSPAPDDDHARVIGHECLPVLLLATHARIACLTPFVMVVLGTTIHEFACHCSALPHETRGWSDQVRP